MQCKYCKGEFKNAGSHERNCSLNPQKSAGAIPESKVEQEQEPEKKPLCITSLTPYLDEDRIVAWFTEQNGNRVTRIPEFIGLLSANDRCESVPCVLILSQDGTLLPPFMIAGFLGMFPKDQEFPEAVIQEEATPPKETIEPETALNEPDKSPLVNEQQPERVIIPPNPEQEPQKKKFLGLFQKKEKIKEIKPVSDETGELVKKIMNASQ